MITHPALRNDLQSSDINVVSQNNNIYNLLPINSLLIRSSSPLIGYGSKKPPSKLDHYRFLSVAEVPIHLQSLLLGASKF